MSDDRISPLVHNFMEEEENPNDIELDDAPNTIAAFFELHGITQDYSCVLRAYSHANHKYEHVCKIEGNEIPDFDTIGKMYGPGKYSYFFTWQGTDGASTRRKNRMKELKFTISEHMRQAHEQFLLDEIERREKEHSSRYNRIKAQKEIENAGKPQAGSTAEDTQKMLREVLAMAGTVINMSKPAPTQPDNSLALMIPLIMKQSENQMNMMLSLVTAMINGKQNNVPQQNGIGMPDLMNMAAGFMNMTKDVLFLKRDLEAPEESIGDKIFAKVEMFLPSILELANTALQKRNSHPLNSLVQDAKKTADFRAIQENEAELAKMVRKFDARFNPSDTDKVLETMGLTRPESCRVTQEEEEQAGES